MFQRSSVFLADFLPLFPEGGGRASSPRETFKIIFVKIDQLINGKLLNLPDSLKSKINMRFEIN